MVDNESRSESPLSDIGSDAFSEEKFQRSRSPSHISDMSDGSDASATPSTATPKHMEARPTKRRRIDDDQPTPRPMNLIIPGSPAGSVSSDSSGSVPTSPSFANLGPTHPLSTAYAAAQANPNDPESADYTQVTRCQWTGCKEPEQGNMDNLVIHITDVHVPPRQKKYYCEWEGCTRKSMPHTSAYALKAHMRSHTKEKPFMCSVPECDRSFTRSDALAKHMRTVHETEALRPSDPIPRGHNGGIAQHDSKSNTNGNQGTIARKLKLTFKGSKPSSGGDASSASEPKVEGGLPPLPTISSAVAAGFGHLKGARMDSEEFRDENLRRAIDMDGIPFQLPIEPNYYPEEIYKDMEDEERSLPPSQWYRLLRRQLRWAAEDGKLLSTELAELKAQTDDLQGNLITAPGPRDDEGADNIRKEEWCIVDNLLERIAEAEYEIAVDKVKSSNHNGENGETDTDTKPVNGDTSVKLFDRVQKLPYWRRADGPAEETSSAVVADTSAAA